MNKRYLFFIVSVLVMAMLLTACGDTAVEQPTEVEQPSEPTDTPEVVGEQYDFPENFYGSTSALTSTVTLVIAGVEPEFETILGSRVRFVNADLIMSQAVAIKERKAQFWNTHLGSAIRAIYGMEEFATEDWGGPQRIRMIWRGGPLMLTMIARETSGMTTVADLRGKKVAIYPGGEGFISACLAHAGLTLDDVEVVPTSGYNDALRALLENRADSAFGDAAATLIFEIQASPGGIVFLSLPHDDKQGWEALQKVNPSLLPYTPPEGWGGVEEAWGVEMLGFPYALFAYDDVDPVIPYGISKVLHEGYDSYITRHEHLKYWTLDTALDVFGLPVPLHSGSIRYFKDLGLWTDEMQEWQDLQLERENQRIVAWPAAVAEANANDIAIEVGNSEWQALWKSYLDDIE